MPNTFQFRRGIVANLPSLSAGEPALTTDQFRIYAGSAGGNRLLSVLHKINGTTAPGVNDDSAAGYSPGSRWIDTTNSKTYVCVSAGVGAAVWQQTSGTGTGGITQLTGDVTAGPGSGSQAATIANDAVTNAKLANMATARFKGRVTSGTGDPEDLTGTQATTLLDTFTSALKGLVPASGGGTTNFLRADGTFAAPPTSLDITGLTAADPADDDEVPVYDTSATANRKVTIQKVLGLCAATPGGRLSTANTDAFEINGGSNTIYYLPVYHARMPLWDGTRWLNLSYSDSGLSIALSGLTANRPYDVFCYSSGGSPTLELLAWTSDTARATGISIQDGRYCKTGDKTRLYLGSIYTNATNSVNQSIGEEPLWNMYHRRERELYAIETADSWTYATTTWRQWNNSSNSRVKFVIGLKAEVVKVTAVGNMNLPNGAGGAVGIGYDSTTSNVATGIGQAYCSGTSALDSHAVESSYATHSSPGSHYFQMLEIARAGTVTFLGDGGTPTTTQSKIKAYLWS